MLCAAFLLAKGLLIAILWRGGVCTAVGVEVQRALRGSLCNRAWGSWQRGGPGQLGRLRPAVLGRGWCNAAEPWDEDCQLSQHQPGSPSPRPLTATGMALL